MDKAKTIKKCKHKFIHKIIKSRSMNEKNKTIYEWLVHVCIKCGRETVGLKLEKLK